MAIVAQKSVSLVANLPTTVVFDGNDFQKHYGYAILDRPVTIAFTIFNPDTAAIYASIRYSTRYEDLALVDKRSFSGVSGSATGATIYITPKEAPALASLKREITSITLSLVSLNTVSGVTVTLEINETSANNGTSGGAALLGLDTSLAGDFTYTYLNVLSGAINPVTTETQSYTPPDERRTFVTAITIIVPPTAYQWGDITVGVIIGTNVITGVFSSPYEAVNTSLICDIEIPMGNTLDVTIENQNPAQILTAGSVIVDVTIKEYLR